MDKERLDALVKYFCGACPPDDCRRWSIAPQELRRELCVRESALAAIREELWDGQLDGDEEPF